MNIIAGFKDTLEILAFRWGLIKSGWLRGIIIAVAAFAMLGVYFTSHLAGSIRWVAAGSINAAGDGAATVVLTYIKTFTTENSTYAIAGVLGALFGSLVLVPLLGYSFSGLVPAGDLVSIRKNDYHLLSDSVVLQFLSSISLVQILFLTLLNSILTLSAQHPGLGIIAGWGVWLMIVLLTVVVSWFFELVHRKYGSYSKYVILGAVFAVAGVMFALFQDQAIRLFGVADFYGNFIRGLDDMPVYLLPVVVLVYLAIYAGLLGLISIVGSAALSLQERPKKKKPNPNTVLFGKKRQRISQVRFFLNMVLHQKNIRKPLMFIVVSVLVSVVIFGGGGQFLYFFAVVIPVFVALSWGVNAFGILGGGTTWLMSLPYVKERILWSIAAVQFILIGIIAVVILIPEIFIYHVDWVTIGQFALALVGTSLYVTRSAINKSVYQPERYRVHIRGEAVLPPGKALAYLARFFIGAGAIDLLVFEFGANLLYAVIAVALIVIWQLFRFVMLNRSWQAEPAIVENIIKSVGY